MLQILKKYKNLFFFGSGAAITYIAWIEAQANALLGREDTIPNLICIVILTGFVPFFIGWTIYHVWTYFSKISEPHVQEQPLTDKEIKLLRSQFLFLILYPLILIIILIIHDNDNSFFSLFLFRTLFCTLISAFLNWKRVVLSLIVNVFFLQSFLFLFIPFAYLFSPLLVFIIPCIGYIIYIKLLLIAEGYGNIKLKQLWKKR